MAAPTYRFKFSRLGGFDQVVIASGTDLEHLHELDLKLWSALAMPTRGVQLDARTLDFIDTDKDGRIRAPDVLAALRWTLDALVDAGELFEGGDAVPLDALKEGPLRAGARRVLASLGKSDATSITVADVTDTSKVFSETRFNGDGVVPLEAAADEGIRLVIEEIIKTHGSVMDRSGKPGVNADLTKRFFDEVRGYVAWRERADRDAGLMPLGDATAAAAAAVQAVEGKVDDFFVRCTLAAMQPGIESAVRGEQDAVAAAGKLLGPSSEDLARLPLARVESGRALPLADGVSPAWRKQLAELLDKAVAPLLGSRPAALTEQQWDTVRARLQLHRAWQAEKPVTATEQLGVERLRALASGKADEGISALIQQDVAAEPEFAQLASLEKLLLFHRDLLSLLNNFVNLSEFYRRKGGTFQAGTLYIDGRACELCIEVTDPAKHGAVAAMAGTFLAYCDCTRSNGEKKAIVAAFTGGDSDNLFLGRNGVFYDRQGRDWDATITRMVSNPISVREAFWSPYKKFARFVEEQIGRRAAAAEAESHAQLSSAATTVAHADKTKLAEPPLKKIDVGTVAALGVAIGGIGAMVTGLLGAFFGLGLWMPVGLVALLLLISTPSMLLAYLKLRQRNLGPLLDAGGWAVNGRARINVPFGAALTRLATLPPGYTIQLRDPYREKRPRWPAYAAVVGLLALATSWYLGWLDNRLPEAGRSITVLKENAPAYHAPKPAPVTPPPAAAPVPFSR